MILDSNWILHPGFLSKLQVLLLMETHSYIYKKNNYLTSHLLFSFLGIMWVVFWIFLIERGKHSKKLVEYFYGNRWKKVENLSLSFLILFKSKAEKGLYFEQGWEKRLQTCRHATGKNNFRCSLQLEQVGGQAEQEEAKLSRREVTVIPLPDGSAPSSDAAEM